MNFTGRNVWMGLAGMYIIDDPADPSTLPAGAFDVPLILVDRSFDSQNQLSYNFDSTGLTGDHILVNGVPQPYFVVGDRKYRFRMLNASNLRDYELELGNGASFVQIGTDSGLLPVPVSRQRILLGPAERVDVVVDFAGQFGNTIVLRNRAATGALSELMQFRVTQNVTDTSSVPATLRPVAQLGDPTLTRTFQFGRKSGQWTINGLGFDANRVDARPTLGATEKWVLSNPGGWSHLVHIHDVDQQALTRNGGTPPAYETTKEVWHIGGGQTVEVKLEFTDNVGRYVFHCHVLEHEDDAMMTQFEVVAPAPPTLDTGLKSPAAHQAASGGDGNGFESNAAGA
ncbi:MAG: multicopper oxidase family protein, partial [Actinomycetota bacterium]